MVLNQLYVKVQNVDNERIYFWNNQYIVNNKLCTSCCIKIRNIENPVLLTDLSIIQKYLPGDHVDKIIKLTKKENLTQLKNLLQKIK